MLTKKQILEAREGRLLVRLVVSDDPAHTDCIGKIGIIERCWDGKLWLFLGKNGDKGKRLIGVKSEWLELVT